MISYELQHPEECRRLKVFAEMIAAVARGDRHKRTEPHQAQAHRCSTCRQLITTPACLACELRLLSATAAGKTSSVIP
ncbi:MAG: hypothetical protein ACOX1P_17280 [Thermoguttaceae bacterium]|jgi:hypothetical protein